MDKGGISRLSAGKLLFHGGDYFVGQLFCAVFQKSSGSEEFMDNEGGVSRFSVEKFFTHSAEKLRRGILYCFTNFRYRKMLRIKERGQHQDFPPKSFWLILPNIS